MTRPGPSPNKARADKYRTLRKSGLTRRQIANMFNLSIQAVSQFCKRHKIA